MTTPRHHAPHSERLVPLALTNDPYLVDEQTMTFEEWQHRTEPDSELVRFHQPHGAQLVA